MTRTLLNFAAFQLGWLACVLLGAGAYHWLGPAVVAAVVVLHLISIGEPRAEARLVFVAVAIGLVWENLLTLGGVVVYPHGQFANGLAPVWIVAMWGMLATTLNVSLRWLHDRPWLALAFGAIGGPAAFFAGERLDAVRFPDLWPAMLILAVGWGALFVALMQLAKRNDGAFPLVDANRGTAS